MEERPPIWRVAANKSNKQLRTADKGWSSSLGVGRDASSGDKTIRRLNTPPLGSPGGRVSRGIS